MRQWLSRTWRSCNVSCCADFIEHTLDCATLVDINIELPRSFGALPFSQPILLFVLGSLWNHFAGIILEIFWVDLAQKVLAQGRLASTKHLCWKTNPQWPEIHHRPIQQHQDSIDIFAQQLEEFIMSIHKWHGLLRQDARVITCRQNFVIPVPVFTCELLRIDPRWVRQQSFNKSSFSPRNWQTSFPQLSLQLFHCQLLQVCSKGARFVWWIGWKWWVHGQSRVRNAREVQETPNRGKEQFPATGSMVPLTRHG